MNYQNTDRTQHEVKATSTKFESFSCLMCVYAGDNPNSFQKALESVLVAQDQLPNEFILVVDGQIPISLTVIIEEFVGRIDNVEIEVIWLPKNVGLARALNFGLERCKYDLVARMDADDISVYNRFSLQLNYLTKNPQIDVLGGQISEFFDETTNPKTARFVPVHHDDISSQVRWRNPMRHPTVMFRKKCLLNVGNYPNEYPEDYFLWVELLKNGAQFANLDKILVHMRTNDAFFRRRGVRFLFGELKLLKKLHSYKYLSLQMFILISTLKVLLRLSPVSIKKWVYHKGATGVFKRGYRC